eukprot:361665-Chlamydomonas_euryale.AAC.2
MAQQTQAAPNQFPHQYHEEEAKKIRVNPLLWHPVATTPVKKRHAGRVGTPDPHPPHVQEEEAVVVEACAWIGAACTCKVVGVVAVREAARKQRHAHMSISSTCTSTREKDEGERKRLFMRSGLCARPSLRSWPL